jgi:hypothetical protein
MLPAGNYRDEFVGDAVNEAVFTVNPLRPTTFELVLEGFGFARTAERRPAGFFN